MPDSSPSGKKGFAALDSMVSDVSEDLKEAERAAAAQPKVQNEPRHDPPQSGKPPSVRDSASARPVSPPSTTPSGGSGTGAAGWVIGAVVVLFLIAVGSSGNKSSSPSPEPAPTYSAAPAPATPSAPAAPRSDSEKPPIGSNNVLSANQIRYCQIEKIRIDAIKSVVDSRKNGEIDRFNNLVNDYNSRCGEFRYRTGELQTVQQEVEQSRTLIADKAKSEWLRSSATAETVSPSNSIQQPNSQAALSLDSLNNDEKTSIESACSMDKHLNGPAAYNRCLSGQLAALQRAPRNVDLSSLSYDEKTSIESACSMDKHLNGPAAYNRCMASQLRQFR